MKDYDSSADVVVVASAREAPGIAGVRASVRVRRAQCHGADCGPGLAVDAGDRVGGGVSRHDEVRWPAHVRTVRGELLAGGCEGGYAPMEAWRAEAREDVQRLTSSSRSASTITRATGSVPE